jgi:hypothetical protein
LWNLALSGGENYAGSHRCADEMGEGYTLDMLGGEFGVERMAAEAFNGHFGGE